MKKEVFLSLLTALVITLSLMLFWEGQSFLIYPNGNNYPASPVPIAYLLLGSYSFFLIIYQIYQGRKK